MLLCDISSAGADVSFSTTGGLKNRGRIKYLLPFLSLLLAGCGYKIVSATEADRYCFACQTSGYAQCRTKGNEQALPMTMGEAEKVLSVIAVKPSKTGNEGQGDVSKNLIPLHIDGYKKY